jgi:hypothetical protein
MTVYHWKSVDFLLRYSTGDIIVEAPGLPEARRKAVAHLERIITTGEDFWWFDDEERAEQVARLRQELENTDPEEDVEVIFVWGSE